MDLGEPSRRRLLEWSVGLGSVAGPGWIGLAMSDPLDSAEPEVPEGELEGNGRERADDTGETESPRPSI